MQRLLFANEIYFVTEQTPDFSKCVGDKMRFKAIGVVLVPEVLGQSLQITHIFRKVLRDVGFEDFEDTTFAA